MPSACENEQAESRTSRVVALRKARFRRGYELCRADMAALSASELRHVNLNVPRLLEQLFPRLAEINGFRAACAKSLPDMDRRHFELLDLRLCALGHAYQCLLAAPDPAVPERELAEKMLAHRANLKADCEALVLRGLIPGSVVKNLRGGNSYHNLARDTLLLAQALQAHWHVVEGKTASTRDELREVELLAVQLGEAVAEAEGAKAVSVPVPEADMLRRAFTLVVRSYEEIRRAVSYLRWHEGDVDAWVPSLYARGKRRGVREAGGELAGT